MQLISSLNHTVSIITVNNEDKPLRILEVVSPQRPNLELAQSKEDKCKKKQSSFQINNSTNSIPKGSMNFNKHKDGT